MTLARIAGLLADETRAAFCMALLDGRAWTAGELARQAGVSPSTASEHLSRLIAGGLLAEERQGRHRYVRLADPTVAALIEDLAAYAPSAAPVPRNLRESTRMSAEARARTCYDHLAGHLGVAVTDAVIGRGLVSDEAGLAVTEPGRLWFAGLGIELSAPDGAGRKGSRPVVRSCLDWTERRVHLAGVLGAALCGHAIERRWVERIGGGRALKVTPGGRRALKELLEVEM
ncbi:winged helix-turn-helix domain-containing protein [Streptomyces sp. NPDC051320]|uniref:ArsR/SmtB family transcription factor n=1 Tax=Streptomyces sp. NPDC051320 TaxID=3154644 RepID=UPI00344A0EEE